MTQVEFDSLRIGDCIISIYKPEKFIITSKNIKYGGFNLMSLNKHYKIAWISSNWEKSELTPIEKIKLL